jgi:hypothetical protein
MGIFKEWTKKRGSTVSLEIKGDAGISLKNLVSHIKSTTGNVTVVVDPKSDGEKTFEFKSSDFHAVESHTVLKVDTTRPDKVKEMFEYIAKNGNCGHSFEIQLQSENSQRKFGFDGDGGNRIISVK